MAPDLLLFYMQKYFLISLISHVEAICFAAIQYLETYPSVGTTRTRLFLGVDGVGVDVTSSDDG